MKVTNLKELQIVETAIQEFCQLLNQKTITYHRDRSIVDLDPNELTLTTAMEFKQQFINETLRNSVES